MQLGSVEVLEEDGLMVGSSAEPSALLLAARTDADSAVAVVVISGVPLAAA